jgi:hypothetical protein
MLAFNGTSPEIRFQATTNSSTTNRSNFLLDDVALNVCVMSTTTTGDYGDLPTSYGAAWHTGSGALRLGALWDSDTTFAADSDNSTDDGVAFIGAFQAGGTSTVRVDVQGTPSAGRWLAAWFDWNADGTFGADEKVFDGGIAGGANDLTVNVPATVSSAVRYRMRLYDSAVAPAVTALGGADGGEDEDGTAPCAMPATVTGLTLADPGGNQLQLNWTPAAGATGYEVWWSTDAPYFTPGADCGNPGTLSCTAVTGTSFQHAALADNPTYIVRAVSGCGQGSTSYPRVGRFRFTLVPGS